MGLTATWGRGARSGPPRLLVLLSLTVWARECHGGQTYNPTTGHYDLCSTIQETDGSPAVLGCNTLAVSNGTLTDNGDGTYAWNVAGAPVGGFPTTRLLYGNGTATPTTSASFLFDGTNLTLPSTGDLRPSANATNALNIANAAGTDFVTFDTTNSRVGIGTTSPSVLLTVSAPSAANAIRLNSTTGTNASYMTFNNTGGNFFVGRDCNTGGCLSDVSIGSASYPAAIWSEANTSLVFGTNNTLRMHISNSGNVGIGIGTGAVPSYKMDIVDAVTTSNIRGLSVAQSGAVSGTGYAGYFSKTGASTTNVGLYATASGATNNYAAIFDAGNVGIGTASPGWPLHVFRSNAANGASANIVGGLGIALNNAQLRIAGTTSGDAESIVFTDGTNSNGWMGYQDSATPANRHYFFSANDGVSKQLVIMNSGNVGIGTTNPGYTLHVFGSATTDGITYRMPGTTQLGIVSQIENSAGSGVFDARYYGSTAAGTIGGLPAANSVNLVAQPGANHFGLGTFTNFPMVFWTNGTEKARITAAGNVGIGTSTPRALLHVGTVAPGAALDGERMGIYADGDPGQLGLSRASTDGSSLSIEFFKSRGTHASPSIVVSGDQPGAIEARAYDGVSFQRLAGIEMQVDGTPGVADMPGRIVFRTTPDGSGAVTERMRLDNAGVVNIGSTSYEATTGLKVANGGLVLANVPINVDVTNDIAQIFTGSLTVAHNESTVDPVILVGYGGYAGGPTLNFAHTRSTGTDANTIVQNGDNLGDILWYGADGANYRNAAQILAAVDGTPAVNDMPSRLVFGTKPGGSAQNITERLRIDSAGGIQIGSGGTTPGKARLALKGGTATATTDWALTSGWGANATISAVTGNDSRGTVTVTTSALDTPTANPVLTLTFKDGTWTSTPFPMANMDHVSTGPSTVPVTCRATATTLVLSYRGTPTATAALTYTFNYLAEG